MTETACSTAADCLTAALAYRRRGWSVIPVRPGSKLPAIAWQAFQDRLAEESEIIQWFDDWPAANIAIVTGPISRLAVLDIDPEHGGRDSLFDWQERQGPLPPTAEVETGGGGTHLYFTSDNKALRNRVAILPGIDLRARGGLVIAPPSRHPSGRRYRWRPGQAPEALPPHALPRPLLALLQRPAGRRGHALSHWRDLTKSGVDAGARNSTLASLCGHLLWHGVDPEVALELLLAWNRERCRPPLDDREVAQVVASITKLHEEEPPERPKA